MAQQVFRPIRLRNRLLRYVCTGMTFGVLAWYLPDIVNAVAPSPLIDASNPWMRLLLDLPFYGIWLIVASGVAWWELRSGGGHLTTATATSLVWVVAVGSYYLYWAALLLTGHGGPQLVVRLDQGWDVYRADVHLVRGVLQDIVREFIFWGICGLIAGFALGWFLAEVKHQFD